MTEKQVICGQWVFCYIQWFVDSFHFMTAIGLNYSKRFALQILLHQGIFCIISIMYCI